MRRHRRQFSIWGGVVAVKTMPYIAGAQSYPALPIAIIVPYAAGGPSDVIARMHGQRMRGIIGPPVLKENIVGAGGSISLGPHRPRSARRLYRRPRELGARACQLDFDLLKDVEPVAQLPDNPLLIVARKAGPGEQGVDRLAESQPGQGIRWDPRRWRRTSRACFSRARLPIRTLSWCGSGRANRFELTRALRRRCTQTGTQGSHHGHHVLLQSGAGRSHLGLQA
jgi:tripartite-type tricarboxylate transporter receptor subunit TctC